MAEHKTQPAFYGLVFVALIALTGLTVWLASVDLGQWHVPVGLGIATTKAAVIALFFMHMLHSSRLTWAVALSTLLFLAILLALTITDYLSRDWRTAELSWFNPEPTATAFLEHRKAVAVGSGLNDLYHPEMAASV
jgi:cytochrome c oxidase subunit IV